MPAQYWLSSMAASLGLFPLLAVTSDQPHVVSGIGIVVRGGVECPHVALENGQVYALDGRLPSDRFLPIGTRVRIKGAIAASSKCSFVSPIAVESIQILIEQLPTEPNGAR